MGRLGINKVSQVGYIFVWNWSALYDGSAEALHQTMDSLERYTDQHLWVEWVEPWIATIDDDLAIEIHLARNRFFLTNVNEQLPARE